MRLSEIKSRLNISSLQLNTALDKEGNKTDWMRHWDNDSRTQVSIHKELVTELQTNPNIESLGLQYEKRQAEKGEYDAYRIVKYAEAEITL